MRAVLDVLVRNGTTFGVLCDPPRVVVAHSFEVVQHDLPGEFSPISAVVCPSDYRARAPSPRPLRNALRSLAINLLLWTRPRQRVPLPRCTERRVFRVAPRLILRLRNVAVDVGVYQLAAHYKAILFPRLASSSSTALIESDKGAELLFEGLEVVIRVLHRHLVTDDSLDVELARTRSHHLPLQVPHHPCQVRQVHILDWVLILPLGSVHVEGHL
mmetsp:Transcript_100502/g.251923  ORF Transcript_100502/g.251923 Transcript_100502/m.251923 type:complete len:215 (+) Transcript_100502:463-1107(+)